jgi:HTH-type transcriptional regulator/antitoxin HigA
MTDAPRPFQPDWLIHPGEHLAEYLESWGMSQAELADRTGLHRKTINAIINGSMSLTPDTAVLLEPVFGMPARFWINLDAAYHERLVVLRRSNALQANHDWLNRFPIKEMQKRGLLPATKDRIELGVALMQFFALGDVAQWDVLWRQSTAWVAYRQQRAKTKTAELVSVWLREGQRAVEQREAVPFDAAKLRDALPRMRQLTIAEHDTVWPLLQTMCDNVGVLLVRVKPYKGLGVYAATYRYRGRTVIQLSGLRRTVDQFWFSFFHEVGHLLLHGVKEVFLDDAETARDATHTDTQEAEANAFAARILIPDGAYRKFVREVPAPYATHAIERFAEQQRIHPAIVVGRLQHDGKVQYSLHNELKESYEWEKE